MYRHRALLFAAFMCIICANSTAGTKNKGKGEHSALTASDYTLYAAGDIADCDKAPAAASMAARTADIIDAAIKKDGRAYALTLGDNTYPIGAMEEFTNCYEPTWGKFKERTLPAPGNHDYSMPEAMAYYNYFGEIAGPDRRGYYRRSIGPWQIYSLNSSLQGTDMKAQLAWLKEELSQHHNLCTLAFWHHPVFSSGGHGNTKTMIPAWVLLQNAKADIVLGGHDHDYERVAPLRSDGTRDDKNGIRSFVVGTGGANLTPMFFPHSYTEIRSNSNYGVLKLSLHEKSYDWQFMSIAGQDFSDQGSANCH